LIIRPWFQQVEIVRGDVLEAATLPSALEGVTAAFYLIHNMSGGRGYRSLEHEAAVNFGAAARAAGVEHIIYLGGLGEGSGHGHMESRHDAGAALRASGVPVTEFRACVIIGTGSISFEIIRSVAHWFPLIPAPFATDLPAQPISTPDLIRYLIASLATPEARGQVIEIGGPDIHLYPAMILECARQLGLRRWKFPLPIYPLELSARIVDQLSPVPLNIARPLMQELVGPSVITNTAARDLFPGIKPMTYGEAVGHALRRDELPSDTPWMDSLVTRKPLAGTHARTRGEGFLIAYREISADGGADWQSALSAINGDPPRGWSVRKGMAGAWMRLEAQRELPGRLHRRLRAAGMAHAPHKAGRLYLEVERNESTVRSALLFEPKGLAGVLVGGLLLRLGHPGLTPHSGSVQMDQI
jgi:uncharacterized protein YbjT (DUF2867 family)